MSLSLEEIESNDFLRPFANPGFEVSGHVTSLLSSTSSSLTQLSSSIATIEQQIHTIVSTNHGDLLAQTANVELMENVVQNCRKRAALCLRSVTDVEGKLDSLHSQLGEEVKRLENLYQARQALRRIRAVVEIDGVTGAQKTTADVASCIAKIEHLCLLQPRLDALQPYHDKATSLRQNIGKQTENILSQGLGAASASQVQSSLQTFANLGVLEEKVLKVFGETERIIEKDVKTALEVKLLHGQRHGQGPGRAVLPSTAKIVDQVWSNLDGLVGKVVSQTGRVKLLWKLVLGGKDAESSVPFVDFISGGEASVWGKFWNNFMDILIRNFSSLKLDFIKAAFENEFPRLLEVFLGLGAKIEENSPAPLTLQSGLRGVISNFEKAYLSKSLSRLFDSVNHNFASVPNNAGIDQVVKALKKEMNLKDPTLRKLVVRNISKTINLVCVKAEQLILNDGNSTQVIGPATESQTTNAQLLNALDYFRSEFPEATESIDTVAQNCINPLVLAVSDAVEAIILTIHNENFQRSSRASEYSLYIGELQGFLTRVAKDYFSLFKSSDLVQKCGVQLAVRTIDLFTRHACLLSSLSQESTRNQLLVDLNHLEIVLTPVCPILSDLGKPYKLLKGFKTLLTLPMNEIASSNLIGSVIPYSLAIQLLFRFSQGEMKMPHTNNAWTITRYSKWLDEHPSETDRLTLLKATLESYVHTVKFKGLQEYVPVYPVMTTLLQKGMLG